MPIETLLVFFATAVLLGLTPGPDNIFVLTQSLAFGQRSGLLVVLGLCTGLVIHTALVAFGIAAVIAASPLMFLSLKILGALYLLYLAWLSWHAGKSEKGAKSAKVLTALQLYRRGFIMNLSNPKVVVFFLAFLPQFADPRYGGIPMQILLLGVLFIVSTLLVFGGIAMLAGRYSQALNQSDNNRLLLNRAISLVFLLIAINLLYGQVS